MTKSQRSSNTIFHQWPTSQPRTQQPTSATATLTSASPDTNGFAPRANACNGISSHVGAPGPDPKISSHNRARKGPGSADFNPAYTPGSPSQIDPFGSQITLPSHIPSHQTANSSRPPSTVLSAGGSPLPGSNSGTVTPKIILASPSTSTIHYLFPSSDTRNGIHLSTNCTTTASTAVTVEATSSGGTTDVKLRRGHSLSRGNSLRNKDNHRNEDNHQHREIPGLRNKRSLPTPILQQQVFAAEDKVFKIGVKKADISKPFPSISDEARDYSKGFYDVGPDTDIMGTLRRQPGMVDLGGKGKITRSENTEKSIEAGRTESVILKEIENRRDRRGWEIGVKQNQSKAASEAQSSGSKATVNASRDNVHRPHGKPYVPPITVIQQRRRSQSLTSPRPAPSPPADPAKSPLLPAPDLGDPLTFSVVIPSPSYSHLDYSPAGSSAFSATSISRSISKRSMTWGKRASVIFPQALSVSMSRGDTRKNLGDYDSAKRKVKEDYENRMSGNSGGRLGRIASIKRSVSLRKKDQEADQSFRKTRPRSQSLTSTKINTVLEVAPPLPSPSMMDGGYASYNQAYTSSSYTGELSIDLGSRYYRDNASSSTVDLELTSPRSADTSYFPRSTTTTSESDYVRGQVIAPVGRRPLHPALNSGSEISLSIIAPSTIGLGLSPAGTPVSLPESLLEEMVDLTETGLTDRQLSSPIIESVITPPTPQNQGILPTPGILHTPVDLREPPSLSRSTSGSEAGSEKRKIPRKSLLLAQNRFYIPPPASSAKPPGHTKGHKAERKPSLKSSRSLGQGLMKRAYTSGNLRGVAAEQPVSTRAENGMQRANQDASGHLLKSASIRSNNKRFSIKGDNQEMNGSERQYGTERISSTYSMRFKSRPLTTFSICSPPDAIDPLPYTSPSYSENRITPSDTQRHKSLRSNKSSPFLSASNSLRVIFGKEGFVARSLSQAFERDPTNDHNRTSQHSTGKGRTTGSGSRRDRSFSPETTKEELKMRISSPLEASASSTRRDTSSLDRRPENARALSPQFEEAREGGRNADKRWRESVLQEALTLSISNSSLNRLANEPIADSDSGGMPRMVSSGSKSRLAIPDQLLAAPTITINEDGGHNGHADMDGHIGVGQSMMQSQNSLESSLNLRAIMQVEDWDLTPPTRSLGVVGKEESLVSAPSMYSNNASTLFEKPSSVSKRLVGKGFPSNFSIAELTKKSSTLSGSKATHREMPIQHPSKKVSIRQISQPIPISTPLNYNNDSLQTFDIQPNRARTDRFGDIQTPEVSIKEERVLSAKSSLFKIRSSSRSNTPEPPLASRSVSPIASQSQSRGNSNGYPPLKLSLKSSMKKRHGISSEDYMHNQHPGEYVPGGTSGNSSGVGPGVLEDLLARDQTSSHYSDMMTVDESARNKDKLRKVLAWRDDVGENENLAKLDQKIRGFVSDERERVRGIGRKSIEG
ncbi:uncharacterized protein I303_104512 [Kwoniella dejecticola CBS 10117]|uniref:Uncharacterized protein n=1 Tax=Kwoniella dejecticola CBS 10117 TaxID=1296121 RepID=A0AAJ8MH19_9TREE